jgi:hypothetical protein
MYFTLNHYAHQCYGADSLSLLSTFQMQTELFRLVSRSLVPSLESLLNEEHVIAQNGVLFVFTISPIAILYTFAYNSVLKLLASMLQVQRLHEQPG